MNINYIELNEFLDEMIAPVDEKPPKLAFYSDRGKYIARSPISYAGTSIIYTVPLWDMLENHFYNNSRRKGLLKSLGYDQFEQMFNKGVADLFAGSLSLGVNFGGIFNSERLAIYENNKFLHFCYNIMSKMLHSDVEKSATLLIDYDTEAKEMRQMTDNVQKKGQRQLDNEQMLREMAPQDILDNPDLIHIAFTHLNIQQGGMFKTKADGTFHWNSLAPNRWSVNKTPREVKIEKKIKKFGAFLNYFQHYDVLDRTLEYYDDVFILNENWALDHLTKSFSFAFVAPPIDFSLHTDDIELEDEIRIHNKKVINKDFTNAHLKNTLDILDKLDKKGVKWIFLYGFKDKYDQELLNDGNSIFAHWYFYNKPNYMGYIIPPLYQFKNTVGSNGLYHNSFNVEYFITNV